MQGEADAPDREGRSGRWAEAAYWLAVVATLLVLTLVTFRVFLPQLRTHLIGAHNDVVHIFLVMKWQWQVLLSFEPMALMDAPVMAPLQHGLAYDDNLLALTLLGLPFAAVGEEVLAFNIALLSTFVLTGVAGAGFVRALSGSRAAGWAMGIACAFFPIRMETVHHVNNLAIMGFALAAWAVVRWHQTQRWRWVGIGGIAAYVQFLSSIQLFIMLLMLCGLWLVGLWLAAGLRFSPRVAVQTAVVALASGFALLPWLGVYLSSLPHLAPGRSTDEMFVYRAFLDHWLGRLSPGPVVLALTAVAAGLVLARAVAAWRRLPGPRFAGREHLPWLLGLILLAVLISLGPFDMRDGEVSLLPHAWLMRLLPPLAAVRVPQRIQRLAVVLACGAAGVALTWLVANVSQQLRRRPAASKWLQRLRGERGIAALMALLVGVAIVATIPPTDVRARPLPRPSVEPAFATLGPEALVLPIPLVLNWPYRPPIDLMAVTHRVPVFGGYASGIPQMFWRMQRHLGSFPSESALAAARATGATHVLVDKRRLAPSQRQAIHQQVDTGPFERVKEDATWLLARLRGRAPAVFDPMTTPAGRVWLKGPAVVAPDHPLTLALHLDVDGPVFDPGGRRHVVVDWLDARGRTVAIERARLETPHLVTRQGMPYQVLLHTPRQPGRYRVRLRWPTGPLGRAGPEWELTVRAGLLSSRDRVPTRARVAAVTPASTPYRSRWLSLRLRVTNEDDVVWLARSPVRLPSDLGAMFLAARFVGRQRLQRPYPPYKENVLLPHDLAPGESAELTFFVRAPERPGDYRLAVRLGAYQQRPPTGAGFVELPTPLRIE